MWHSDDGLTLPRPSTAALAAVRHQAERELITILDGNNGNL
jgi:hypothetical protein